MILYYKTGDVLESYQGLKKRKLMLDETGGPNKNDLQALSKDFMQLLSYPDNVIEEKLSGKHIDPFILIE